jgi:hypothetical protein
LAGAVFVAFGTQEVPQHFIEAPASRAQLHASRTSRYRRA